MYGGYSVAGLTRQFVALKTVSSNLTTHPTEYVLHFAERIFFACQKSNSPYRDRRGDLGSPAFFYHQFFVYAVTHLNAPLIQPKEKGRQPLSYRPDPEVIYFIKRNFCCQLQKQHRRSGMNRHQEPKQRQPSPKPHFFQMHPQQCPQHRSE